MKTKTVFNCQQCGYQSLRWLGKCPDCNQWNCFLEESYANSVVSSRSSMSAFSQPPVLLRDVCSFSVERLKTDIHELDNVLGGGIVSGSVILIGGDPGIGKSTISLQISARLCSKQITVLYVSGEESMHQTKLRADRIGESVGGKHLYIVTQNDLSLIMQYVENLSPSK